MQVVSTVVNATSSELLQSSTSGVVSLDHLEQNTQADWYGIETLLSIGNGQRNRLEPLTLIYGCSQHCL